MGKILRFEDLECWQSARELVNLIYKHAGRGEFYKDYDTKGQIKKASLSIMNNIAEGFARYHKKDFVRFLDFAQSSAAEVKSIVYICYDQKYIDENESKKLHDLTDLTRKQILGLIRYLERPV